jgi:hypothetical protein
MSGETLAVIILVILVLGTFPTWPYANSWGYGPSGILTAILIIFLIWAIIGERPLFRSSAHNTTEDIKAAGNDLGHDLKAAGRNVADSVRNTFQ